MLIYHVRTIRCYSWFAADGFIVAHTAHFQQLPMLLRAGILAPYEVIDLFNLWARFFTLPVTVPNHLRRHFERINVRACRMLSLAFLTQYPIAAVLSRSSRWSAALPSADHVDQPFSIYS